jgi:hypothetical protein
VSGWPARACSIQTDGSRHRWFGPDLPYATLVGTIDDATSRVTGGTFRAAEDAAGYFTAFAQTAKQFRLPGGIYSDRHSILSVERNRTPTLAEQLTGRRSLTRSDGRSMRPGSAGSGHAAQRPRVGSSGSGARSRTGS